MEPNPNEDENVILPEEGSGKAFENDLDEIQEREPYEEKTCTGASSASD